jgi:hypothetical protein
MGFSVSDIIMQQGDAAAKARQARGTMWGSLAQYAGTIPREIIAGEQQKREQAQVAQVRQLQIQKGQAEQAKADEERGKHEVMQQVFRVAFDPATGKLDRPRANAIIAQSKYSDLVKLLDDMEEAGLEKQAELAFKQSQTSRNLAEVTHLTTPVRPPDYTLNPGDRRLSGETNTEIAAGADKPAPPLTYLAPTTVMVKGVRTVVRPRSDGVLISVRTGEPVTEVDPDQPPRSSAGTGGTNTDVHDSVAGMMAGTLPPQMPGRASKDYTAIMAEAQRQGFDLAGAVQDWTATQKHIASLNGTQQLRLNQSIGQLPELLDTVDALASQWKGGRFPILNRANLAAAKGGAYGDQVASIAQQLDAQIADITSDLGNVYMGGNSPTDKALALAGTALKGDWSEKVLHDMVALAKKNVIIRQHSIANTGVMGASPDNPYAPTQAAPPAAPTAPAGWKYVPKAGGGWTAVEDK